MKAGLRAAATATAGSRASVGTLSRTGTRMRLRAFSFARSSARISVSNVSRVDVTHNSLRAISTLPAGTLLYATQHNSKRSSGSGSGGTGFNWRAIFGQGAAWLCLGLGGMTVASLAEDEEPAVGVCLFPAWDKQHTFC